MEFDFVAHELVIKCENGDTRSVELFPRTVADFYRAVKSELAELKIDAKIWLMPVEVGSGTFYRGHAAPIVRPKILSSGFTP